jgi:hypothetical protein
MDLRHIIFSVNDNGATSRCTQGNVQDRPLLGEVHVFPVEHGIDSCPQAGLFRQVKRSRSVASVTRFLE